MPAPLSEPEPLRVLVEALRALPGVGVRTARRMAYHLLQHNPQAAVQLGAALQGAVEGLQHCQQCHSFSQEPVCPVCRDAERDASLLCVVESPADQQVIESSHGYDGLYYVLMGRLAPLEGVGPEQVRFAELRARATDGVVREVILATSFTAEGETTAYYLADMLRAQGLKVSRLARGVPSGSELEYVDAGTLAWALMERRGT
ncbi:recombination mediator RecR [Castellaniella sp.]|uniref:recombination mediator RecR n=1 Tax=Castellaniella sp. TaxID=1955812 RepID=UPI003560ECFE